jgi:hypothetical protein
VCVCVCVCERERERERESYFNNDFLMLYLSFVTCHSLLQVYAHALRHHSAILYQDAGQEVTKKEHLPLQAQKPSNACRGRSQFTHAEVTHAEVALRSRMQRSLKVALRSRMQRSLMHAEVACRGHACRGR